jgi:RecA/RadA recombinase
MDEKFKKLFDLTKKNDALTVFAGDDLSMGSVAPYGISTGIAELDLYLGAKAGLPASKVIEFFGKQMCGKTTAALQAAAEWQKRGGLVIFIDTEKSFDPKRARELGCVPEDIFKHEADTIEEIFKVMIHYFGDIDVETKKKSKKGTLDGADFPVLVIVDSVTGVPTIADAQGDIDASDRPGFEAKQIKRGLKKVNPILSQLTCKPTIIFINHAIAKIGAFGKKTDSGGGMGIKFYSTVRVEFTAISAIKNKTTGERLGQKIKVFIEKLKGGHLTAPDMTLDLTNDLGFDRYESLKLAMISTGFAARPAGAQVVTILPGTPHELQFKQTDFRKWVEETSYDEVYNKWRKWCVKEGYLQPWGGDS